MAFKHSFDDLTPDCDLFTMELFIESWPKKLGQEPLAFQFVTIMQLF